jgi:ubiquinone biosynthesis protein
MAIFTTGKNLGRTIKSAGRLRTIVGVFAKHGFQNILERARLGRFVIEKFSEVDAEKFTAAERMRMAFEELGPTFVKFGQLLATRSDLIPEDFIEEFKKLHDRVEPEDFEVIQGIIQDHYKRKINEIFESFDEKPLGSASIAQVHAATVKDGTRVVVKVQRPGIQQLIRDDLAVLFTMAGLLERYVPEARALNPVAMVEEFFKTLQLETDFAVEANNIRRFQRNFENDKTIRVPRVFGPLSGKKVLVMEYFDGIPLSQPGALEAMGSDSQEIVKAGLMAFFRSVFQYGFFHGDLHAGNLIILPDSKLGLIDFGVVGRLSRRTQDAVAGMFLSLANEDYEQLAYEYTEVAPFNELVDANQFARDLREMIAPHYGLSFKDIDVGKLLMSSANVAARYKLRLPSELMLLFKALVSIEGMGRLIVDDFDVLSYSMEFATEIVRAKYDPARIAKDLVRLTRESTSLVSTLPRQLKILLKRLGSPDYAWKIEIDEMEDLRRSLESSSNIIFLGIIISSLVLSASALMFLPGTGTVLGIPALSFGFYALAILLGLVSFYNYIRK